MGNEVPPASNGSTSEQPVRDDSISASKQLATAQATEAAQPLNAAEFGATRLLPAAAGQPEPAAQSVTTAFSLDVRAGQSLGQYELIQKLGEGGMGQVWKARHARLDKFVALKLLPPQLMVDPVLVDRFNREMKVVAKLQHPNVVCAHDAGEFQGLHYLVLDYVDGQDLGAYVKEHGPRSVREALGMLLHAAQGLEHAHQHGVVHRDIKPSNLFLTKGVWDGRPRPSSSPSPASSSPAPKETIEGDHPTSAPKTGKVMVLDLGLALLAGDTPSRADQAQLTRTGQVLGTPDYMAPEQWDDTHSVDGRADLYALGCTLFFLLTGRAPYHDGQHNSIASKMKAHSLDEIPDLTAARLAATALRPKLATDFVSPEINALYRRLMAKRPENRFQSATELIAALRACRVGQAPRRPTNATNAPPVSLAPASTTPLTSESFDATVDLPSNAPTASVSQPNQPRFTRTHIAAAIIACVLLLTFGIWQLWDGRPRPSSSDSPHAADSNPIANDAKAKTIEGDRPTNPQPPILNSAVPDPSAETLPAPLDPQIERDVALSLLRRGGTLEIHIDGDPRTVTPKDIDKLPAQPFAVTGVDLHGLTNLSAEDIQPLTRLSQLWSLNVSDTEFSDSAMPLVSNLRALTTLTLDRTRITDAAFRHLTPLSNLEALSLQATQVTGSGFDVLKSLPRLREIQAHSAPLTASGVAYCGDVRQLRTLVFGLAGNTKAQLDPLQSLRSLRAFAPSSLLRDNNIDRLPPANYWSLKLNNSGITGRNLPALVAKAPGLLALHLPGLRLTDADLPALHGFRDLEELMLHDTQITDTGLEHLRHFDRLRHFSAESGTNNTPSAVTAEGVETLLSQLRRFRHARGDTELQRPHHAAVLWAIDRHGKAGVDMLEYRKRQTQHTIMHDVKVKASRAISAPDQIPQEPFEVRWLSMKDIPLTDADFAALTPVAPMPALHLSNGHFTDDGVNALARFQRFPELNIGNNPKITDASVEDLLKISVSTRLYLDATSVTSAGASRLLMGQPTLKGLSTGGEVPFTAAAIDALPESHPVELLNIAPADLTPERVRHLARLPHLSWIIITPGDLATGQLASLSTLPMLNDVTLYANQLTPQTVTELQSLPAIRRLWLYYPGDIEVARLTALTQLTGVFLTNFRPGTTPLTDRSLDTLRSLPFLKHLQIDGDAHTITAPAAAQFRTALPHCKLLVNPKP